MMIPLAAFGNFMGMDGLVIMMVLLLLFGAKKLPELARGLGQSLNEFKKAREDIESEFKHGQQDPPTPREASNRQVYGQTAPVTAPTQALAYDTTATEVNRSTEQALQQQIAELQQKLQTIEAQKQERPVS